MKELKEIQAEIAKLPETAATKPILAALAEHLQSSSSSPVLAAMRQELDALKATPSHTAGLCGKQECRPCQDARVAVGHQVEEGIIQQFEGAAVRYGLQDELALLAEAVKHHRAEDAQWSPRALGASTLIQVG